MTDLALFTAILDLCGVEYEVKPPGQEWWLNNQVYVGYVAHATFRRDGSYLSMAFLSEADAACSWFDRSLENTCPTERT